MYSKFREQIEKVVKFTDNEWNLTEIKFKIENFKKNEVFLKEGKVSNKIGFVVKGILRTYKIDESGEEITTNFNTTGTLVLSGKSFNERIPAEENIVTLEDVELFTITFDNMNRLYEEVPKWHALCKRASEIKQAKLEEKSYSLQNLKAADRYKDFIESNPEIIQKVPLGYIASYLGIKIETLSRIRKKI